MTTDDGVMPDFSIEFPVFVALTENNELILFGMTSSHRSEGTETVSCLPIFSSKERCRNYTDSNPRLHIEEIPDSSTLIKNLLSLHQIHSPLLVSVDPHAVEAIPTHAYDFRDVIWSLSSISETDNQFE